MQAYGAVCRANTLESMQAFQRVPSTLPGRMEP
jgi:cytochrome o ubiquinol oxidase subunit 2